MSLSFARAIFSAARDPTRRLMDFKLKTRVMDAAGISRALSRLASQIVEQNVGTSDLLLVGNVRGKRLGSATTLANLGGHLLGGRWTKVNHRDFLTANNADERRRLLLDGIERAIARMGELKTLDAHHARLLSDFQRLRTA